MGDNDTATCVYVRVCAHSRTLIGENCSITCIAFVIPKIEAI